MNLQTLKKAPGTTSRRKRLGRGPGSGTGKTCGKGHKGQMARKGHKHKLGFEGGQMPLVRRLPKRGFKNRNRKVFSPVNVARLARFEPDTEVTWDLLKSCGLAKAGTDGVKVLGQGEIDRKLTVKVQAFSESARAKIEAAGGVCEVTAR